MFWLGADGGGGPGSRRVENQKAEAQNAEPTENVARKLDSLLL